MLPLLDGYHEFLDAVVQETSSLLDGSTRIVHECGLDLVPPLARVRAARAARGGMRVGCRPGIRIQDYLILAPDCRIVRRGYLIVRPD